LPQVFLQWQSGQVHASFSLHSFRSSHLWPSPWNPGGHRHPDSAVSEQAEKVWCPLVSDQHPPLLRAHLPGPTAWQSV